MNPNKTKDFDWRQEYSVIYDRLTGKSVGAPLVGNKSRILPLLLIIAANLSAQDRKVEATWLHRYVPSLNEANRDLSSPTCHYKPIFGTGDGDDRILRSVSRFAEVSVDAGGSCQAVLRE